MTEDNFQVKTEKFEGPLELLLSLIEKRKLLINDISLAQITDDYLGYLKDRVDLSMAESSNFILVASTLLLIKSKSLLPTLELSQEEEQSINDLETRLKIFRRLKEVEKHTESLFGKNSMYIPQQRNNKNSEPVFAPSKQISLLNLKESALNVLKSLPKKEIIPKAIVKKVISLEETIQNLTKKIQAGINMSFREFSKFGKEEKVNVIVGFLAMLELVKQGIIEVSQNNPYEDIEMQTKNFDTPSYI